MNKSLKIFLTLFLLSNLSFAQSKGCVMTEMVLTKGNQPINKILIEYDKFDNVLSRETIQYFDGVGVSSKVLIEYNSKNKPTKTEYYFRNQLTRTVNKTFDNAGNLLTESESKENKVSNRMIKVDNKLEQLFLNEDGTVSAKHVSETNANSEVFTKYDAQNNIISTEKKILSTSGKTVEKQSEDFLGKVKKTEKYQYNNKNDLTKKEDFLDDQLESYTVFEYANELLTKVTAYTKKNQEDYRLEYKYVGSNQTEEVSYYRNELANRKVKEYDANNNCIKETSYTKDGQIINVSTFKYTCK